uniref:Palmitoyltransferase n=1 Tax=Dendroctonus ponderosae TaxID=77166 RepID=A0AAR5PGG2_DENPD
MAADAEDPSVSEEDDPENAHIAEQINKDIFDLLKMGATVEVEAYVVEYGVEVLCAKDEWGYTPAHWVALDGNVDLMRLIIDSGAPYDQNCLGTQGPRPIHWACRKGHTKIVQLLLQAGVPVNCADFKGLTPLMTACMFGKIATAAYLLGMGASHHLVDINGDTAMHWAAHKGHADIIPLLVNAGADMQKRDNFGSTPLHLACLSGSAECVGFFCFKSNVDLNPKDKNNNTPIYLAARHGHKVIVKYLSYKRPTGCWLHPVDLLAKCNLEAKCSFKRLILVLGIVLSLWCYPFYFIKVLPLTWNVARGSNYSFIYWNIVLWISWIVANRKNPGYAPMNTDTYLQVIQSLPHQRYSSGSVINSVANELCFTCRTIRPPRAKHCRICNRCVYMYDHHCNLIYNCVGLRNRVWFFVFQLSLAINWSYACYFASYCFHHEQHGLLSLVILLEGVLFAMFATLCWMITCTILLYACMNITTNEMMHYKRYSYLQNFVGRYKNYYSRGPIFNLIEFFFSNSEELDRAPRAWQH